MAKRSNMLPLALVLGGVALIAYSKRPPGVSGLGDLGFSIKKAVKKAVGGAKKVGQTAARIDPSIRIAKKVVTTVAKKSPDPFLKTIVAKVSVGGAKKRAAKPQPQPGQAIQYQDENGNPISEAEYNRRQAEYDRMAECQNQNGQWNNGTCRQPPKVSDPVPTPIIDQAQLQQQVMNQGAAQYGGGGGGGGSSFADSYYGGGQSVLPAADSTPAPSMATESAPDTGKKMNPLVAVAAFAAVPLLGMLGDK